MTDSSAQEAVLAANQAFYDAFSNRNIGSMNLVWWQGSTSLCVHPGGRVLMGWEEIRASWESIFNNTDSLEIDLEVLKNDWVTSSMVEQWTLNPLVQGSSPW